MRETGTETGGAIKGLKAWIAVSVTLIALLGALGSGASAASADSPWWGLTSGARPAYIHPGSGHPAVDEVQKLVVEQTAGGYALEDPAGIEKRGAIPAPLPEATYVELPFNASAAEIQTGLEEVFGSGNAQVAELAPGEFTVTWTGSLSGQAVRLSVEGLVTITESTKPQEAKPDGEIYVTAENLGNETVSGASQEINLADVLPKGLKAVGIAGTQPETGGEILRRVRLKCDLASLSCTLSGVLAPYDLLEVRIAVVVEPGAESEPQVNKVSISGGEGFVCNAATAGAAVTYSDSGCVKEVTGEEEIQTSGGETVKVKKHGGFARSATGSVAPASLSRPVTISQSPTPAGVENYELVNEEAGGTATTQAGAHPFQSTTTIALNQGADGRPLENPSHKPSVNPIALQKDLHFQWPAGMIGNPTPVPQCTDAEFFTSIDSGGATACPPDSAVGVATVTVNEPSTAEVADVTVPLFNLKPGPGEPARLGFNVIYANAPVVIDTSLRSGGDYGITVSTDNITQVAAFLSSEVTVWGTPGSPSHNRQRGWACLKESRGGNDDAPELPACSATETRSEPPPTAFLTLPTSCSPVTPATSVEGDTWAQPGAFTSFTGQPMTALDSCNRLPFDPEIKATPDQQAASTPSGLNVDVHVPQEGQLNGSGLAESNIRGITVKLPAGVAVNPSSADGLEACSEGLVGFTGFGEFPTDPGVSNPLFSSYLPGSVAALAAGDKDLLEPGKNFCPNASKIGEVTIKTPLLPNPLTGYVYLAAQEANPFNSVLAMYIVAEDPVSGSLVKLPGEVQICQGAGEAIAGMTCETAGQLVSTFANNPQVAFEDAELHFFGGERAPLTSPTRCGTYTTEASFTPWSGTPPVRSTSSFNINSGPNHSPCPGAALPFSPTLTGGATNLQAGAFSPFTLTMSRLPGEQNLQSVEAHLPPGLSGILSNIELCPEPQANAGACGPNSLIGETTVSVGVGGSPYTVSGGKFFLTGPYNGTSGCTVGTAGCAPFGITFEVPAKAGPFDFAKTARNHPACDCVLVRGKIEIDPLTAAITIVSNPPGTPNAIPTHLEGIPLEIQKVNAITTRGNFQFNPTNCNKMAVSGTIHSSEGGTDTINVPLQVTNCGALKFAPKFSVSTKGANSKANGATLTAKVTYPSAPQGTYANITRVKVDLPKQLPSRLTTLQKACTNAQFELNPANCPKESKIGFAKVTTPLLPVPLEGPAIFVSHGGEAFPSLTMVLQGYGVTVDLVGTTFISKAGITSTTFKTVPDVPFSTFTLTLPQGKFSALAANVPNKNHYSLCGQSLTMPTEFLAQNGLKINESTKIAITGCAKKKALTRTQKLTAAIKACHKKAKGKRAGCEKAAHKKYGALKKKKGK